MLRTDDIRRLLEVKDFSKNKTRRSSIGSDDSDRSDLSTKSMPQYSSYRALSGGLFGPFEKSPSRPSSKSGFLHWGGKNKTTEMSHIPGPTQLKTPSAAKPRGSGEGSSRPSSRAGSRSDSSTPVRPSMSRENSASKLPVYRRESSMPQMRRESSIPLIKREKSDIRGTKPPSTPRGIVKKTAVGATPRGSSTPIVPKTTPKTVAERKVSERNIPAKGTRSGISGIAQSIQIGDRVAITGTEKRGIVQFVGETRFSKGVWAGVVLDDKTGKNDGSVGGVRYFSCPALRGVFVKEEKLQKISDVRDPGFTPHGTAADRIPNSRNDSALSTDSGVDEEHDLNIGDTVAITSASGKREGVLRFIGLTEFAKGTWCGVELKEPTGKNDGAVAGTRYFQCEAKHGLFAQITKVKKLSSSSSSVSPHGPLETPQTSTPVTPTEEVVVTSIDVTPTDSDASVNTVEIAVLHDTIPVTPVTNEQTSEQSKKIAALQLQLHKQDEELQVMREANLLEKEKVRKASVSDKIENHEKFLRENQENTLRLQDKVSSLERENNNLQNELNDNKQKIEDLQFQLEEQLLLASEEGPSNEELEKVLGLEGKMKEKEKEISALQSKLEKSKIQNDEELARMSEKDQQLEGKEQEIFKITELLTVTKENEALLSVEVTNLKQQIQDLRDLQSSVSDAEKKSDDVKGYYENKLVERDQKVLSLQDELKNMETKISNMQKDINEKNTKVSDVEFQLVKNREELQQTLELQTSLNKQLVELNTELSEKRSEIQSISAATEATKHQNLELKAKLEAAESRNENLTQDKKKMEEDILKVSKNSGDNAQQLVYLNETIQSKNSELTALQDKLSTLTAENHKLVQELIDFKETASKERTAFEKEKNEENKKLRDSIVVLEEHYKQIKIKNNEVEETAQKEKLELQKSSNEIDNLQQSVKSKTEKLELIEKELNQLKIQYDDIIKTKDSQQNGYENKMKELSIKAEELETLKTEILKYKSDSHTMKENNEKLTDELTNLRIERTNLEKRVNCTKLEKEELQNEKDTVTKSCDELLNKIKHITKEKVELEQQVKIVEDSKNEISKRCSNLEEELKSSISKVEEAEKEALKVSELSSVKTELEESKEKYVSLESQNVLLEKDISKLKDEKEELGVELTERTAKESDATKELSLLRDQLKQAIEREQNVRTTLEAGHAELESKIKSSNETLKTKESEASLLTTKIAELQKENSNLLSAQRLPSTTDTNSISSSEYQQLKDELEKVSFTKDEKEAEVDFLNSIIVDLQKKNKDQDNKIKILTYGDDLEETSTINDTMSPVKPGLRVRVFCDICDVFDLHDTEDCPKQSNETGGSQHHGVRGEERVYCTACETFGHTAEECDDEEMF